MIRKARLTLIVSAMFGVVGCGGGGSDSTPPPPPPPPIAITKAEAFQFLNQATFGATEAEADSVIASRHEQWISDQFNKPASVSYTHLRAHETF